MKSSTKAALLSCLVFPGAGHFYLKRFALGVLLSFGAAVAVYFVVLGAMSAAFAVAEKIQSGGVPLDVKTIAELVSEQTRTGEDISNSALILLIVSWLIGIFDSYRIGRALEKPRGVAGAKET